jgi:uncharacterized delta-60 repeat protein
MLSITNTVRGLFARPATPSRPRPRRRPLRLECLEERTLLCNPGELDLTFDGDGKVTTTGATVAMDVALQTDGKIVVAGRRTPSGDPAFDDFAVVRYTASGALDTTFGGTGVVLTDVTTNRGDQAKAVAIQSDGKIIAAGHTTNKRQSPNCHASCNLEFALVRYNANGTLDSSFGSGGKVITNMGASDDTIQEIVIQPDGKIVAVGQSSNRVALARYNSNGTLDSSFDSDGKLFMTGFAATNTQTPGIVLQPDGKIVLASSPGFARFNANVSLDTTFGTGGTVAIPVSIGGLQGVALQADGSILVIAPDESGGDSGVARFTSNGVLDTTFGTNGIVFNRVPDAAGMFPSDVTVQADGKILVTGRANVGDREFFVFRYTTAGVLDTSFDTDGIVTTDFGSGDAAHGIVLQPDGKIVAVGSTGGAIALARYCA